MNIKLGIIYNDANVQSLKDAIYNMNKNYKKFNSKEIINYSKIFNPNIFEKRLKEIITNYS